MNRADDADDLADIGRSRGVVLIFRMTMMKGVNGDEGMNRRGIRRVVTSEYSSRDIGRRSRLGVDSLGPYRGRCRAENIEHERRRENRLRANNKARAHPQQTRLDT